MTSLKQLSNEWYLATALYDAIDDGNLRAITSLVQEKNANANVIIPDYGYTPLHLAVGHENENFGQEVTKLLMKNGGDPNVKGTDGVTPLHVAVAWNRSAVAQLLLSYGADPWIQDTSEKDAFDYANEQQAWDTLRALEALKCSKYKDSNFKLKLDKVIIHSNDVQAEYRATREVNVDKLTPKNKQSVSTQTPCPFVRSPLADTDEILTDDFETHDSGTNRGFDKRYDWCDKSNDVITEECKRTIYRHRARSSMFEYSPRRSAIDMADENPTKTQETKKRFFPPVCCIANDLSFTDDSLLRDSDEKETVMKRGDVNAHVKASYDSVGVFSEDSLMTEDHSSDSKSSPREWNLLSITENIPYIDDTTSGTNASQNADSDTEPKILLDENKKNTQMVVSHEPQKEVIRHVSWPDCISSCACIPSREDDDSFTVYSSSQEKTEKESGIETLSNETKNNLVTTNVSLEYKVTEEDDGIEFIAAKMPLSNSNSNRANIRSSPEESDLSSPTAYDTDYIRRELKKLGFVSGPIVGTPTKKLYLRKLRRLRKTVSTPMKHFRKQQAFSSELEQVLDCDSNWIETLSKWANLETIMRDHFQDSSLSSTWRTGTAKTSFTYLLLDPRISNNLPSRCEDMDLSETWRTFVNSIFYIGKGTRAREYEHLREALDIWYRTKADSRNNLKVSQILEIWKEGLGVVCVQTFRNLIPAEAFTREAAMIDAIGLSRLKNEKGGMYYGTIAKWNAKLKKRLGVFLLYRAMRIFIADNEIQLKPTDVN